MNASFLPPQAGPLLTRHLKMGAAPTRPASGWI